MDRLQAILEYIKLALLNPQELTLKFQIKPFQNKQTEKLMLGYIQKSKHLLDYSLKTKGYTEAQRAESFDTLSTVFYAHARGGGSQNTLETQTREYSKKPFFLSRARMLLSFYNGNAQSRSTLYRS